MYLSQDIYELVDSLDEHVTVVGTETGALALEAHALSMQDGVGEK